MYAEKIFPRLEGRWNESRNHFLGEGIVAKADRQTTFKALNVDVAAVNNQSQTSAFGTWLGTESMNTP